MITDAVICSNISKTFHSGGVDTIALRGVDLTVRVGELVMLVGPSGCGKTTLISTIAGILLSDSGSIEVLGRSYNSMSDRERTSFRGKTIGFVFQSFNLIPTLTVQENVAVPLLIVDTPYDMAMERSEEVLVKVGLKDKVRVRPADLSGGQQQRVAIARSLIHNPKLIVCDEPTSALDKDTGMKIMELFREVVLSDDRTLIVVSHDSRILGFADRIARMNDGRIEEIVSNVSELNGY